MTGAPFTNEEPRDTSYYDDDLYDDGEQETACRNLWGAVIEQAIKDALNPDDGSTKPVTRGKNGLRRRSDISAGVTARRWITGGGDEFFAVCQMAIVDRNLISEHVGRAVRERNIRAAEMDEES